MVSFGSQATVADPAELRRMAARIAELVALARSAEMTLAAELLSRAYETLGQEMCKRGLELPAELGTSLPMTEVLEAQQQLARSYGTGGSS